MQPQDRQPLVSMTIYCHYDERFIEECPKGVPAQTELIITEEALAAKSVAVSRNRIHRYGAERFFTPPARADYNAEMLL